MLMVKNSVILSIGKGRGSSDNGYFFCECHSFMKITSDRINISQMQTGELEAS